MEDNEALKVWYWTAFLSALKLPTHYKPFMVSLPIGKRGWVYEAWCRQGQVGSVPVQSSNTQ